MQTVEGRARPLKPIRTCWIDAPRKASPSNPSSHVMCSNLLVHISALQSCFLCNIAVWADSGPFCSRFVCLNKRQIITKRGIKPIFTPICQLHRDEWITMLFQGLNLNGRPECYWTSISVTPLATGFKVDYQPKLHHHGSSAKGTIGNRDLRVELSIMSSIRGWRELTHLGLVYHSDSSW